MPATKIDKFGFCATPGRYFNGFLKPIGLTVGILALRKGTSSVTSNTNY